MHAPGLPITEFGDEHQGQTADHHCTALEGSLRVPFIIRWPGKIPAGEMSKILAFGMVGYYQWQVSANGGTLAPGIPASRVPYYSVHAIGVQTNFMLAAHGVSLFFKYEPGYLAKARPLGRTIVFGGSWTLRIPK